MPHSTIIDVSQLKSLLDDPNLVVIDCRFSLADTSAGRQAFYEQRIPRALYADLDEDLSGPPTTDHGRHPLPTPEKMSELFSRLGIDETKQVVAYDDRNSMLASRLWWMLRYMGHEAVAVLDGGWNVWVAESGPVDVQSTNNTAPATTRFTGAPNRDRLVVIDEVLEQPVLIDSRAPERYRGEVEPLDPTAGRIPGAKNRFFALNLDDEKKLRSTDEIKAEMLEMFGEVAPKDATFYCGSGVSACVNLLAAVHAGLPMSKLYVGSWSEWSKKK